jgi:lysozyme
MMRVSDRGELMIKGFESPGGKPNLKAYRCPAGVLTVGWGHTGEDVAEGEEIDEATAEVLFRRDISKFERVVNDAIDIAPTTQSQRHPHPRCPRNAHPAGRRARSRCHWPCQSVSAG